MFSRFHWAQQNRINGQLIKQGWGHEVYFHPKLAEHLSISAYRFRSGYPNPPRWQNIINTDQGASFGACLPQDRRLKMNIEKRIKAMHDEELKRLVDSLNFMLSGATIGEAEAFEMMAELEAVALAEYRARGLGGDLSS